MQLPPSAGRCVEGGVGGTSATCQLKEVDMIAKGLVAWLLGGWATIFIPIFTRHDGAWFNTGIVLLIVWLLSVVVAGGLEAAARGEEFD